MSWERGVACVLGKENSMCLRDMGHALGAAESQLGLSDPVLILSSFTSCTASDRT